MKSLYNPNWNKKNSQWVLENDVQIGTISELLLNDNEYVWKIVDKETNKIFKSDFSVNSLYEAKLIVQKLMNYNFFVEPEYSMSIGCKCGSCSDPTGKWLVSNSEDSINLLFDSEEEAIKWVEEN